MAEITQYIDPISNDDADTKNSINQEKQHKPPQHSKVEDTLAMVIATFIIAFGLLILQDTKTLTGGTAGLALVIHYATGIKFSILFFLINIPFYYLCYKQLGVPMLIKTFITIGILSVMTEVHPLFFHIEKVNPLYGTVLANVLFGVGFLILFRHRSTLGGFNLLALYLHERYKLSVGKVMMMADVSILFLSLIYMDWLLVLTSILGVAVLNLILDMNHRSDRYVGQ